MVVLHAFKKDMTARSRSWEADSPVISVKCFEMLAKELQKYLPHVSCYYLSSVTLVTDSSKSHHKSTLVTEK